MGFDFQEQSDGIIRVTFTGDIEERDALASAEMYKQVVERTPEDGVILFLVDVSRVGKSSFRSRKAFIELFSGSERRTTRTAVVGANRYVTLIADFILRTLGKTHVRLFDSESEALAWLKHSQE